MFGEMKIDKILVLEMLFLSAFFLIHRLCSWLHCVTFFCLSLGIQKITATMSLFCAAAYFLHASSHGHVECCLGNISSDYPNNPQAPHIMFLCVACTIRYIWNGLFMQEYGQHDQIDKTLIQIKQYMLQELLLEKEHNACVNNAPIEFFFSQLLQLYTRSSVLPQSLHLSVAQVTWNVTNAAH